MDFIIKFVVQVYIIGVLFNLFAFCFIQSKEKVIVKPSLFLVGCMFCLLSWALLPIFKKVKEG